MKTPLSYWIVVLLFILSGLSSLIYQVIWTRYLVFVFGSTSFASSTVLAVFMGGLALGSFVAGRFADKIKNPFLWYGILEGVIGLFALIAPSLFDMFVPFYRMLWQSMHLSVLPFSLIRFAVVTAILITPTACMGATLPLLAKFVTDSLEVVGKRVGILYSMNTLGAVLGALLAGFVLIPNVGIWSTTIFAAVVNALLLVLVLFLSRRYTSISAVETEGLSVSTNNVKQEKISREAKFVLVAFAISGAVAMIYEVAWTRSLLMVIGSTTYAFSIMLSTFLAGIFLGGLLASRIADKVKQPVIWFGYFQVLLCLGGFLSLLLFNFLPYWNLVVNFNWPHLPEIGMFVRMLLCGVVLLPITLLLGAIFPFAVKSCAQDLERLGRSIGTLYSVNTLGAIAGAFAGGFLIIPLVGVEHTLILCAVTNLLLGMGILLSFSSVRTAIKAFAGVALLIIVVWALQAPALWDREGIVFSQSARRVLFQLNQSNLSSYDQWLAQVHRERKVEFWKDGLCAHVCVLKSLLNGHISLLTNGHVDASDWHDMSTQEMLSVLPLLCRPQSQNVAIIGWGSGVTLGYSLLFPVQKVTCVEIEPEVVRAARLFSRVNLEPEKDKRLVVEYNDGRNYLLATAEKFDVIVSEPSNPWQAGVCNLFTKQYFHICHDRLTPNGVFSMWCQAGEVSAKNISRILGALKSEFKHVTVFQINDIDTCVLASDEPLLLNLKSIEKSLANPRLAKLLKDINMTSAEDIAARIYMVSEAAEKVASTVTPNTDDMNYIEYNVAKTYEQKQFARENCLWFLEKGGALWDVVDWSQYDKHEKASEMAKIADRCLPVSAGRSICWAKESYELEPNAGSLDTWGLAYAGAGQYDKALKKFEEALSLEPHSAQILMDRGFLYLSLGQDDKARDDFSAILKMNPQDDLAKYRLAQTYSASISEDRKPESFSTLAASSANKARDSKKVLELIAGLDQKVDFIQRHPGVFLLSGENLAAEGKYDAAIKSLEYYLMLNSTDPYGWRLLGNIYARKGDETHAAVHWAQALSLGDAACLPLLQRAEKLMSEHQDMQALALLSKARDLSPMNPKLHQLVAQLAGTVKEARTLLEDMARTNQDDLRALSALRSKRVP